MFSFFKKRSVFDDEKKNRLIQMIAAALKVQLLPVGDLSIESPNGDVKPKAIGYVYGFIDAALRGVGQDMGDVQVGIPFTFQVLRDVFPGHEKQYMQYLIEHVGTDKTVMLGVMIGGQQYNEWIAGKLRPMGLAKCILEDER